MLILNLMLATRFQKVWTGACLPLCCITSSSNITNISKRWETEEISCWSFESDMLSHSCLKLLNTSGLLCSIFHFISAIQHLIYCLCSISS